MTQEYARSCIRRTFVLICFLAWPLVSSAATYTVPGNYPTIQAAINGVPSGSTIDVAPGTYPEALSVSTPKSFTVRGVGGPGATIVDAVGKNAPALTVYQSSGQVVFSGITFRRGGPPTAAGGGFVITSSSPSFFNCIFESNTASGGAGGAMFGSNATFTGCIIRGNTARGSGGGVMIMSGSRPVFTNTSIINNISGTTQPDGVGGGVDSRNSSPSFRGSHINANTGKFAGGGIYHAGNFGSGFGVSTLVMEDSEVSANVASPLNSAAGPAEGGGIHIEDNAVATLTRVHVVGNRANSGGGLTAYRARYDVVDSRIDGNLAQNRTDGGVNGPGLGGGIYASSTAPNGLGPASVVNLTGTLVRNSVSITGGGIVVTGDTNVRGTLTLTSSTVDRNQAQGQGGGILVSNANLTTTNSLIIRNAVGVADPNAGGQVGGGIDITTNSTASITTTTIAHNTAGTFGGGIFMFGGSNTLNMSDSNVYENTASGSTGARGGGLFVGGSQSGTIQSSIIGDNHGAGGQIQEESCTSLSYQGNTIAGTAFSGCAVGGRATGTISGAPRFAHFLATPRAGTSTTLAWSVGRATSVTIAGVGTWTSPNNSPTGHIDVSPSSSTTFALNAPTTTGANHTANAVFTVQGPPPPPPPPPSAKIVDGDFDGDGKADVTVFRPSSGTWFIDYSGPTATAGVQWGNSADVIVPGDYDGDRKTDIAVFRPSTGTWLIVKSSTGAATGVQWGNSADVPVPGDYDGDGKTDVAVFRPSNGTWLIVNSSTGAATGVQWGNSSDRLVPGDYDGDRKTDVAVFRPSTGTWFIVNSSTGGTTGIQWGNTSDIAVPGDYDGDGKNDAAVFRPSTGTWFIVRSSNGATVGVQWGNSADIPVPGDFDGDGKTDVAVFRPSSGTWFIVNSSTGGATGTQWGNSADIPLLKRP
jgi:putative transposon-encoded protein